MKLKKKAREVSIISAVYVISQIMVLFVYGHWWDDWHQIERNFAHLYQGELLSSLPLNAFVRGFFWLFPDGTYRFFVFANYYIGSILLYGILHRIDLFSERDCFWITLLYVVMPINDARMTWICSNYSIGLLTFWVAFYLAVRSKNLQGIKALVSRIALLLLLLFAYNTESIMMMTLLILAYYLYEETKTIWKREWGENAGSLLRSLLKHLDLIILPIVFYCGNHLLFPAKNIVVANLPPGIYRHNYIDWEALPVLLIKSPVYAVVIFVAEFVYNFYKLYEQSVQIIAVMIVSFLVITVLYLLIIHRNKDSIVDDKSGGNKGIAVSGRRNLQMLLLGWFCYYIGLFPYYIKNHGYVATREYDGRHALLLGLGSAMIVYYTCSMLKNRILQHLIFFYVIVFGVVFFSVKYLDWQKDYYQSLRFECGIKTNQSIPEKDKFFLYVCYPGINVEDYRFNGAAYEATGEWEREFFLGTRILKERDADGVIVFENKPISYRMVIRQMWNRIFCADRFNKWIIETSGVTYIPIDGEISMQLYDQYTEHGLTRDDIMRIAGGI